MYNAYKIAIQKAKLKIDFNYYIANGLKKRKYSEKHLKRSARDRLFFS